MDPTIGKPGPTYPSRPQPHFYQDQSLQNTETNIGSTPARTQSWRSDVRVDTATLTFPHYLSRLSFQFGQGDCIQRFKPKCFLFGVERWIREEGCQERFDAFVRFRRGLRALSVNEQRGEVSQTSTTRRYAVFAYSRAEIVRWEATKAVVRSPK